MLKSLASTLVRTISLATIAFFGSYASAQSLHRSFISAFQANSDLAAAQAQVLVSNETYNQNVANTRLQVNGSASASFGINNNSGSYNDAESIRLGLSATQALFQGSFDGIPAGVRQSLAAVTQANATYKVQEMGVFQQVVNAYMGVLREEASLGVSVLGVRTAQREVEAARARLTVGEGTQTDVALANASLAQAQANLALAQAGFEGARASFRQVVSASPSGLTDPGFPTLPRSLSSAISLGMDRHPGIESAAQNVLIAEDGIITTEAQYGLSVNATASATSTWGGSFNNGGFNGSRSDDITFGIQGSIPLYTSGMREASMRAAEQRLAAAHASHQGQRAAVRAQIESAWANCQAQIARLNSLIALTSAQEVVLRATQAEFDAGTATTLQVLTAQQNYSEAQTSYLRAKADAVVSAYNLLAATGGLTTEALGLNVTHFNALARLNENRNLTYQEMLQNAQ